MDAKYRIHSLPLEVDLVEELATAKVVARDACRSRRMALGMAKAPAYPIEILAQCRIANTRESDPGFVAERQDAPAPTQGSITIGASHRVEVETLLLLRPQIKAQNPTIHGGEIYVLARNMAVVR